MNSLRYSLGAQLGLSGILFVTVFLFLVPAKIGALPAERIPFQDPDRDIDARVDDLIARLTLEEKAALMRYDSPAIKRLGIPAYNWWNEALHGVARAGKATVFPQVIGLAAGFDPDLVHRVAVAISDEARVKYREAVAKGNRQQNMGLSFWSPNINIFRDPRWGRGQETFGEDPFLTSLLACAYVRGMQGNDPVYLKTAACAKHFVVHSGPEATRHEFNARPDEIDFHETYLPAFRALVDAGVAGVMCAYNQLDGLPCCGSDKLLRDILRRDWGFEGYIVSDCWALQDFITHQKIVDNGVDAAVMALNAGVNLNCGANYRNIPQAVMQGKVSAARIDALLKPLLRIRFRLGLFDLEDHSPYRNISDSIVNCDQHKVLAREAAQKSIVLLKNDGRTLPLSLESIRKIYLTGPTMADNIALLGNYNGFSGNLVTFLEGIVARLDSGTSADYTMGTLLTSDQLFSGSFLAEEADVIIAALGNTSLIEGENGDAFLSESGGDRLDIALPVNQVEMVRRLRMKLAHKPLIVIVTGGGAIELAEICSLADAVLFAWYPGEQGGNAMADILFGDVNPSGRLPVTFYAAPSDIPPFEDYSMDGRSYRFFTGKALFPFGYGLSYTRFSYSDMVTKNEDQDIQISLTVKNCGDRAGDEVVQLYLSRPPTHERTPIRSLCAIQRVQLEPGERKTVQLKVKREDLYSWNPERNCFELVLGRYFFSLGGNSAQMNLSAALDLK